MEGGKGEDRVSDGYLIVHSYHEGQKKGWDVSIYDGQEKARMHGYWSEVFNPLMKLFVTSIFLKGLAKPPNVCTTFFLCY